MSGIAVATGAERSFGAGTDTLRFVREESVLTSVGPAPSLPRQGGATTTPFDSHETGLPAIPIDDHHRDLGGLLPQYAHAPEVGTTHIPSGATAARWSCSLIMALISTDANMRVLLLPAIGQTSA